MSLIDEITKVINGRVAAFAAAVSEKCDVPITDIAEIWEKATGSTVPTQAVPSTIIPPMDDLDLLKANKSELAAECKRRGIRHIGKKAELLGRLMSGEVPVTVAKVKKMTKKQATAKMEGTDIIKKVKQDNITVGANKFGNYEHEITGLVFSNESEVIGRQNDDGSVDPLTDELIELCNKYKFDYAIPLNLDEKTETTVVEFDDDSSDSDVEILENSDSEVDAGV